MYVGTVGVYDGTVGLYVGTLGTLYDGTVGVYDGTVGVYDGTVGVYVGESILLIDHHSWRHLPPGTCAFLCMQKGEASDGFGALVYVQEFRDRHYARSRTMGSGAGGIISK